VGATGVGLFRPVALISGQGTVRSKAAGGLGGGAGGVRSIAPSQGPPARSECAVVLGPQGLVGNIAAWACAGFP